MVKVRKENKIEQAMAKYNKVREALIQICDDFKIPHSEYVSKFPEDISGLRTEIEIQDLVRQINDLNKKLIKELCLQDWSETIYDNFDEKQRETTTSLYSAMIQCDASSAYVHLSKINAMLKILNDEKLRECGLRFLENYCSSHSFEDVVNNYDLIFRSKHAKDASKARDSGFEKQKRTGAKRDHGYRAYFNASEKKNLYEIQETAQPEA